MIQEELRGCRWWSRRSSRTQLHSLALISWHKREQHGLPESESLRTSTLAGVGPHDKTRAFFQGQGTVNFWSQQAQRQVSVPMHSHAPISPLIMPLTNAMHHTTSKKPTNTLRPQPRNSFLTALPPSPRPAAPLFFLLPSPSQPGPFSRQSIIPTPSLHLPQHSHLLASLLPFPATRLGPDVHATAEHVKPQCMHASDSHPAVSHAPESLNRVDASIPLHISRPVLVEMDGSASCRRCFTGMAR